MGNIDITKFNERVKRNKIFALIGVLFVLLLSCAIIGAGLYKYDSDKSIIDKTVETRGLNDTPTANKACCLSPHKVGSTPIIVETNYNNTTIILLYTSILAFIILSLWGAFTVLLKVLQSENEINSKILDVQKDIYKEQQMTAISNEKKVNNAIKENEEKLKKYEEILKKIEMLEEGIELIKSKVPYDDKKILDILKKYIGITND